MANYGCQFNGTSALTPDTDYYVKAYVIINNQVYYSDADKFHSLRGTWKQLASFPGPHRMLALSFSVEGKVYLIGGRSIELQKFNDVWCYDPAVDTWTEKLHLPVTAVSSEDAVMFAIDNIAYLISSDNFWKYHTDNDTWEDIGDGKNTSRTGVFSFGVKAYIGNGQGWSVYDTSLNSWTYIPNFVYAEYPGDATYLKYTFTANGKGYSGFGLDRWQSLSPTTEFYEYDPVSNMWSKKESYLYYNNPKTGLTTFCLQDKIYVGMGRNTNDAVSGDLNEYDPKTSTWNYVASIPGIERTDAFSCATSIKGYVGLGFKYYQEGQVDKLFDFWEFKP